MGDGERAVTTKKCLEDGDKPLKGGGQGSGGGWRAGPREEIAQGIGEGYWLGQRSRWARSDGYTYTASPEWKEQFMLCFIKMCIILLF